MYVSLIKISVEDNNNRYFRMTQQDDVFLIETGRVGARPVCSRRPMCFWDETLAQKLAEGYVNRSEYTEIQKRCTSKYAPIKEKEVAELVRDLMGYANQSLEEHYSITYRDVSTAMIKDAEKELSLMSTSLSVAEFNEHLKNLFQIIPRKMKNVEFELASAMHDFPRIIEREESLLDVMRTKVAQEWKLKNKSSSKETILEALGLDVRLCDEKENAQILKFLTEESGRYFKRAFRVRNQETDKAYEKYCQKTGAKTHYLYHGSKNRNYMGIISEGLSLNPNATITGKMFGYGLYFAPRAKKSLGYTDLPGSYWAHGNNKQAYLAVYKVAYHNPKDVDKHELYMSRLTAKTIAPNDALYAHKGVSLINDEVIVYDEKQTTLQYLIELEG